MSDNLKWPNVPKIDPPSPHAHVTVAVASQLDNLSMALKNAFQDAMAMRGRLRDEAFKVRGFSGKKIRLFFNNLMSELTEPRYLEIGVYYGASFCSAMFRNKLQAVGIDNWTWITEKDARAQLDANVATFKSDGSDIHIVDSDFRKVDYSSLGKFNVMYYDGPHSERDQYDGVMYPMKAMESTFILIVDDWNWDRVRSATFKALNDSKASIEYSIEIRTSLNGELPLVNNTNSEWHNGLLCAVISKSATS
jgi:hypothetical protein